MTKSELLFNNICELSIRASKELEAMEENANVKVNKTEKRRAKEKLPIPKFLKKYVPKKNFEKIFNEELRRIDGGNL